jgi:hypothetical protein
MAVLWVASPAIAEETETAGESPKIENSWAKLTITPGLQMWQPLYADSNGIVAPKGTLGLVTKVHYGLTDMFGVHVRGAYGFNKDEIPGRNADYKAWAAGIGADFFIAISDKAMWYNTMGLGYGQSSVTIADATNTLTSLGAYFVTGFDVKVMGNMGVWMDWGCQVVGPTTGTVTINSKEESISTYHINPLGAGGMRLSF